MGCDYTPKKGIFLNAASLREGIVHQLKTQGIKIKGAQDKKTQHLIEEIERAQRNSSELNYLGEQKVDYYVKAAITRSTIKKDYSKPIWCPMCKKKREGSCEYDLRAGLQLEVLSLPSLRRMKHDSVKMDESFSVDVFDQCQPYNATPEGSNEYKERHADIIETLVSCTSYSLNNFLAPEAYIEKYFSDGKKHIYQLSAGRTAGIKRGDSVSIFRMQASGKTKFGEAKVIAVKATKAFIQTRNDELREGIRLYDRAKVQYGSMLKDMACSDNVTKS